MGRPSKLTPEQWADIERRMSGGEKAADLAREHGVSQSQITRRVTQVSQVVRNVAVKVAEAQTALAALPAAQQYNALSLADKLRSISHSMAAGAELGAKNFHRLSALANNELQKVDDANVTSSEGALKVVAVLTKMANDAAATPVNLLAANKDRIVKLEEAEVVEGAPQTSGVLAVPGMMADTEAWSAATRSASFKQGE